MKKLFILRKYIYAESVEEALKIEKKVKPDEIFLDGDWKEYNINKQDGLGFNVKKK